MLKAFWLNLRWWWQICSIWYVQCLEFYTFLPSVKVSSTLWFIHDEWESFSDKHLVVNMKSKYRNDWNNGRLEICLWAAASHICPYIVNLVTKKWRQVSDMLPGLKMELWIPIFFFALTLIFVTWILNVNLLKNMPPCHSLFWTGPLAKNGVYHWFNLIFTECSTCSDSLFT